MYFEYTDANLEHHLISDAQSALFLSFLSGICQLFCLFVCLFVLGCCCCCSRAGGEGCVCLFLVLFLLSPSLSLSFLGGGVGGWRGGGVMSQHIEVAPSLLFSS